MNSPLTSIRSLLQFLRIISALVLICLGTLSLRAWSSVEQPGVVVRLDRTNNVFEKLRIIGSPTSIVFIGIPAPSLLAQLPSNSKFWIIFPIFHPCQASISDAAVQALHYFETYKPVFADARVVGIAPFFGPFQGFDAREWAKQVELEDFVPAKIVNATIYKPESPSDLFLLFKENQRFANFSQTVVRCAETPYSSLSNSRIFLQLEDATELSLRNPLFLEPEILTKIDHRTTHKGNFSGRAWVAHAGFVFMWLFFAMLVYGDPAYRRAISRFFNNPFFFASDTLKRHIRIGGLSIGVAVGGFAATGFAHMHFGSIHRDTLPMAVMLAHYPLLSWVDTIPGGFFLLGFFTQALMLTSVLVWLRFAIPGLSHFSQISPLVTWHFHYLLVAVPMAGALFKTGSSLATHSLLLLFVFAAIYVASIGSTLFQTSKLYPVHRSHIQATIGLPLVLLILIGGWVLFSFSGLPQVLGMVRAIG